MQTSVRDALLVGQAGGIYDFNSYDSISKFNGSRKTDKIDITAADLLTTVTINGTAITVNSGAATKTKAELAELLAAAIVAADVDVRVVDGGDGTAEYVTVEANEVAQVTTVVGTTNCSITAQLAVQGANIAFGTIVTSDTTNSQRVHSPRAAADITNALKVVGVALRVEGTENTDSNTNVGYESDVAVSIGQAGYFWVLKEAVAISKTDSVYVRYSASGTEVLGAVRNDADTADAAILPNAEFVQDAAASDEVALVRIRL